MFGLQVILCQTYTFYSTCTAVGKRLQVKYSWTSVPEIALCRCAYWERPCGRCESYVNLLLFVLSPRCSLKTLDSATEKEFLKARWLTVLSQYFNYSVPWSLGQGDVALAKWLLGRTCDLAAFGSKPAWALLHCHKWKSIFVFCF